MRMTPEDVPGPPLEIESLFPWLAAITPAQEPVRPQPRPEPAPEPVPAAPHPLCEAA